MLNKQTKATMTTISTIRGQKFTNDNRRKFNSKTRKLIQDRIDLNNRDIERIKKDVEGCLKVQYFDLAISLIEQIKRKKELIAGWQKDLEA